MLCPTLKVSTRSFAPNRSISLPGSRRCFWKPSKRCKRRSRVRKIMSRIDELIAELCPTGVEFKALGELLNYEQPGKYLVESVAYDSSHSTPVLTAGQTFILGYTDEKNGIYPASPKKPVVIFDDFTTAFKWVDFPFKAKSSAMKMLTLKADTLDSLKYAYYAMQTITYAPQDHARQWIGTYSKFPIPVPPLEVQREIVKGLDTFTKLEAELEAELEARRRQYKYYRDARLSFDERMSGASKQASKQALWATLNEVATFKYGFTAKAANAGEFRFIRITDGGKVSPDDAKYVNSTEGASDYLVQRGDVLMARTGATFGKTVLIADDMPAVYASFLIRIRLDETEILPNYYWHFAQSSLYWQQANSLVSMGGQPQFNANVLKDIRLPIPSMEEQERIVAILNKFDALVNDLSSGLPAEIKARRQQYAHYRDRLLTFKEAA